MLEKIEENAIMKLKDNYYLSKIEEKGLFWLFDITSGKSYKLNEVSYSILSSFDGEKNLKSIKNNVLMLYGADKEIISNDFDEFVNNCIEKEIIRTV
jgi:hypothetical protein